MGDAADGQSVYLKRNNWNRRLLLAARQGDGACQSPQQFKPSKNPVNDWALIQWSQGDSNS